MAFKRTFRLLVLLLALFSFSDTDLQAIADETNQERWNKPHPSGKGPDAKVPGFLVNMGPTGARGILTRSSLIVKHIFPGSPADGKLQLNDVVYGVFGKEFSNHFFNEDQKDVPSNGIRGPIFDMGMGIERAESSYDGKLKLMVQRKNARLEIDVQLERLGAYADTWPVNCAKTDKLKKRAYKYLKDNPGGTSSQGRCVIALSLLSSGIPEFEAEGKRLCQSWNRVPGPDTWSWHLGFQAITLAEYHLFTGDKSVLGTLETVMDMLRVAQWKLNDKGVIYKWPTEKDWGQSRFGEQTLCTLRRWIWPWAFQAFAQAFG